MPAHESFHKRSLSEGQMGSSIALEAQRIVRDAASPIPAGETVKGQLRRAARALGYSAGDWRMRSAWYGEASTWSAAAFEQLRDRHRLWRRRQAARSQSEADKLAFLIATLAERLQATDAEFHRDNIAALVQDARRLGDLDRRMGIEAAGE